MDHFIIDFDSTFTQVEALDELARISLKNHPDREQIYEQIEGLTNASMEGRLSFTQSLENRVKLLQANREHLKQLVTHLKKKVSTSFSRNTIFFKNHADEVLIVSGGFKEFIIPVVTEYFIKKENIYANTFEFDAEGKIIGYDRTNPGWREKCWYSGTTRTDAFGQCSLRYQIEVDPAAQHHFFKQFVFPNIAAYVGIDHAFFEHQAKAKTVDPHIVADGLEMAGVLFNERCNQVFRNPAQPEAA